VSRLCREREIFHERDGSHGRAENRGGAEARLARCGGEISHRLERGRGGAATCTVHARDEYSGPPQNAGIRTLAVARCLPGGNPANEDPSSKRGAHRNRITARHRLSGPAFTRRQLTAEFQPRAHIEHWVVRQFGFGGRAILAALQIQTDPLASTHRAMIDRRDTQPHDTQVSARRAPWVGLCRQSRLANFAAAWQPASRINQRKRCAKRSHRSTLMTCR
jgi:hypothetical protein